MPPKFGAWRKCSEGVEANTMQQIHHVKKWSPEHEQGLSIADQVHNLRLRDIEAAKIQPYTPPEPDQLQPYASTSEAVLDLVVSIAKPVGVLAIAAGAVAIVGSAVVAAVGAVFTVITANAVPVTAGIFGFVILWGFVARLGGSKDTPPASGVSSQNISVTVNVAGQNVNNGQK